MADSIKKVVSTRSTAKVKKETSATLKTAKKAATKEKPKKKAEVKHLNGTNVKKIVSVKERAELSKYQKIEEALDKDIKTTINGSHDAKAIFNSICDGESSYLRMDRYESTAYDETWIIEIENALEALSNIVGNPKKTIKETNDVVPVELAKKTNAESVRHLIQHSQFVKSIDEKGNIIPNKILNIGADDDFKIYENKFIATLIKRLMLFVEKRYSYIIKIESCKETEILYYKNTSHVDGMDLQVETRISLKRDGKKHEIEKNNEYLRRLENIRRYTKYFYGSAFMGMFKNERDVRSPIIMTNILRKNPNYHKCYELFKFIERYDGLGISYSVDERFQDFNKTQMAQINRHILNDFLALRGREPYDYKRVKKVKVYTPKILSDIDDDIFTYTQIKSDNPIRFIRIDDEYLEDIQNILNEEKIRANATKREKEFFATVLEKRKLIQAQIKALENLKARKETHTELWNQYETLLQEHTDRLDVLIENKKQQERERVRLRNLKLMQKYIIDQANKDASKEEQFTKDEIKGKHVFNKDNVDDSISGEFPIKEDERLSLKILNEIIRDEKQREENKELLVTIEKGLKYERRKKKKARKEEE